MADLTFEEIFQLALQHHSAGRFQAAEQLYRQVLALHPQHADALHNLGELALRAGQNDIAVDLIRQAISVRTDFPEAYNDLGIALKRQGQNKQAIAAYRRAIALKADFHQAHNNLGVVLRDEGQLDEAIAAYQQVISIRPKYAEAHNNLGILLKENGQIDKAIAALDTAIALKPNYAEAHFNLGNLLKGKGRLDDAVAAYRRAIALRPTFAEACNNLGNALNDQRQSDQAIAALRQTIAINPKYAEAYNNLGISLKENGQLDEAIAAYQHAIALRPDYAEAHCNLGVALENQGRLEEAMIEYRQTIALRPDLSAAHSNLVFAMCYRPDFDASMIAEEQRRWNLRHAEPLRKFIPRHSNNADPDRRLRVGYVSTGFRDHVVGRNIVPLFKNHDHQLFEITCYAQVPWPDNMTGWFKQNADCWRNTVGLSDEELAKQIHDDQIDIVVDLALHAGDRLLVFAYKPAPVQVTFAGYPGSTGLTTIDYRLSDPFLDPPGMDESIYSEQTVRLPHSFWCYDPMEDQDIQVNSLPLAETGVVTFGGLNNFCKINDQVLLLWAQVLRQVKDSRLLLLTSEGSHRQRTMDRLRQAGIDPARIQFAPRQSRRGYLELFHRVDVGLDTFPYNGHTTSLDSFWMGVPVISLVGQTVVSRAGWSQLSNLGLTELAAHSPEQFVQKAVELAGDLPRLRELRSTLRRRMEQSPLMDAPKFAHSIEAAYRGMWQQWCETVSVTS
jgi:protein O-GlcNAc transferase